jgi:hypothetical protein
MTEPLKFLADIPAMTGGKDAILAAALKRRGGPFDPGVTPKQQQKFAVSYIVEAIKDQLRAPLTKRFEDHCRQIEDDYALLEGDPPGDDGPEAKAWNDGLDAAAAEAFSGELEKIIGKGKLKEWIFSGDDASALTELVLEHAVDDVGNAFARLGIMPADIDSLVGASPEADASAAADPALPRSPPPTGSVIGINVAATGSWVGGPNAPYGPDEKITVKQPRRRAPKIEGPTPLTEAAAAALMALKDHSRVKDEAVAAALGVSRASVIGYREGKTLFEPTDAQTDALRELFNEAVLPLDAALKDLEAAGVDAL